MTTKSGGWPPEDDDEAGVSGGGPVVAAASAQLDELGVWAKAPALCATAMKVALTLDATKAARDLAALAREFRMVIGELERIAAEKPQEGSAVDEIAARRAERLAAAAGSARESGA